MRIALLTPGPTSRFMHNYAYTKRMAESLRALGHTVDAIELAGEYPLADERARQSAQLAWSALADALPLIDGRALPAFAPFETELHRAVAVINHPTPFGRPSTDSEKAAVREVELRLLPRLRRVICTNDEVAQRVATEFAVEPSRVCVVPPGTDQAVRSVGSGEACCHILSVGDLIPRKGHDVLLRALARLFDLDWRLTIVGNAERDPDHAAALHSLADELSVTRRVRFAGDVDRSALEELWRSADLFALAAHWDGCGAAIAEALRRGLPVAVTAAGAGARLVPIEGGSVCRPGDHEQLSKSLRRLIFDTTLRQETAEAAWQAGRALPSWTDQAQALLQALAQND
jgi:glycosyltransferase involved in cell wall biosynthesis